MKVKWLKLGDVMNQEHCLLLARAEPQGSARSMAEVKEYASSPPVR